MITRPADLSVRAEPLVRARAWAATWWRAAVPYAALTVLGLGLRLVQLGEKPFHHDESLHAWFAWQLVSGDGYRYDPVYHGPVQFYVIALAYLLFGVGDYVAHVPVAVAGTIAIFLPFFLRRQLGTVAALTASLAICLAPAWLYFSRFVREDIHVATITLGSDHRASLRFFDAAASLAADRVRHAARRSASRRRRRPTSPSRSSASSSRPRSRSRPAGPARGRDGLVDAALVRGMTGLGVAPWLWGDLVLPRRLHAALLDVPDQPAGAPGGALGKHRLLARPAGRQPGLAAVVLLPDHHPGLRVADRAARPRRRRRCAAAAHDHATSSSSGRSSSRSPSSPGRRSGCRGSCSTRCCRSRSSPASAPRRCGSRGGGCPRLPRWRS